MAQASKKTRQIRRLKRQRSQALRMAEFALIQRDQARVAANLFATKLQEQLSPEPVKEGEIVEAAIAEP